jgi:hypothetical protein
VITHARKSIAGFKVREQMPIGAKVTLRGNRMYEFMDRLVTIALPRVRDFRGLNPKSFDGRGNFAMGIKEHIVFPEINYDKVDQIWGMDVIVCTTAPTDDEARALAQALQLPVPSVIVTAFVKRITDHGESQRNRKEQAPPQAGRTRRVKARRTQGDHTRIRSFRSRNASVQP